MSIILMTSDLADVHIDHLQFLLLPMEDKIILYFNYGSTS